MTTDPTRATTDSTDAEVERPIGVEVYADEAIARVFDRLAATQRIYAQVTGRDMTSSPQEWADWFAEQAAAIRTGDVPGWLHGLVADKAVTSR